MQSSKLAAKEFAKNVKYVSDEEAATEQTKAMGSSRLTSQRAYVFAKRLYSRHKRQKSV